MSLKYMISFAEVGFGFARRTSSIEVPPSLRVHDVIRLACEDYNTKGTHVKPTAAAAAAVGKAHHLLRADDVYLASSEGEKIDSEKYIDGTLRSENYYLIKMVSVHGTWTGLVMMLNNHLKYDCVRKGNETVSTGFCRSPVPPGYPS